MPVGRTARLRRVFEDVLSGYDYGPVLVLGSAVAVRHALPNAPVDVVGTNPHDEMVTVVSEGMGADSLPRRWTWVFVTENPSEQRLEAAVSACRADGVVVVVAPRSAAVAFPDGTRVERDVRRRAGRVLVARVGHA